MSDPHDDWKTNPSNSVMFLVVVIVPLAALFIGILLVLGWILLG